MAVGRDGRLLRMPRTPGLVLIAILLGAVLGLSLPGTAAWQRVVQDAAHGPVFAAIAVILALMMTAPADASRRTARNLVPAFAGAVLLGVATELAQRCLPGRFASVLDVFHDAVGAVFGLAALVLLERRGRAPWFVVAALLASTVLAWEPLRCAAAYAARRAAFPVLAQAGYAGDRYFLQAHQGELAREPLPDRWRRPGEGPALALRIAAGAQPAFDIDEPEPDWRGYRVLALDVTNPGTAPVQGVLRIHDRRHNWEYEDRFNLPVLIPPRTRATLRVAVAAIEAAPRGRRMDLAAVDELLLFTTAPVAGDRLYVSRVWLE